MFTLILLIFAAFGAFTIEVAHLLHEPIPFSLHNQHIGSMHQKQSVSLSCSMG